MLAIAAAKLGWAPVLACDIEPESVEAAREGAAVNGVTVEVTRCDVRQGGPYAPTVLANLVRPLLLEVAANLASVPERLIISGLEGDELDEVVAAFGATGCARSRAAMAAMGRDRAQLDAPMITLDDVQAAARPDRRGRAPHAGHHRPLARRGDRRRPGAAQGREPPARRRVQVPRRVQRRRRRCRAAERARGVATVSSGNHAQALALAARLHEVPAVILMPEDAPAGKLAATRGYGAEIVPLRPLRRRPRGAARGAGRGARARPGPPVRRPARDGRPGHGRARAARGRRPARRPARLPRRRRAAGRLRDRDRGALARTRG